MELLLYDVIFCQWRSKLKERRLISPFFTGWINTTEPLKSGPGLNITHGFLPFLWVNSQTQDHGAPVGARGNYLERACDVTGWGRDVNYLGGFTRCCLFPFSFVPSLYGLINYETMHRWFIWEQEMFKPFFFLLSRARGSQGEALYHMSEVCRTLHNVLEGF